MTTLADLITLARAHSAVDSDKELGLRLDVSRQTLNDWRSGAKRITDEHLAALIELAGADPTVALQVRAAMAKSAQERRMWAALARRLGVAAVVALAAILPHPQANAGVSEPASTVCIMRNGRRWASLLARGLFAVRQFWASGKMRGHEAPMLAP